jgi:hypothetical protein
MQNPVTAFRVSTGSYPMFSYLSPTFRSKHKLGIRANGTRANKAREGVDKTIAGLGSHTAGNVLIHKNHARLVNAECSSANVCVSVCNFL